MSDQNEKKPDESGEKKPKVKGRRLSTSIRGGATGPGATDACPDSGGGGGGSEVQDPSAGDTKTGWGCTRSCNGYA